ncbi:hypothetical protein CTA2_8566 [Colletotrichum tanaceti]|uniref:Uncharacterized protein n=1 Tax=Colletotrichum tanaceti TaxID=1306861 RepID=A0A4U6XS15_9PEZI|nr:hypothetical protein CTA2_8566 [Colletotrichum tanaceti]TKW58529.1 hypothetical protein CTA1_6464 [Colletotrichum tanaceti]
MPAEADARLGIKVPEIEAHTPNSHRIRSAEISVNGPFSAESLSPPQNSSLYTHEAARPDRVQAASSSQPHQTRAVQLPLQDGQEIEIPCHDRPALVHGRDWILLHL